MSLCFSFHPLKYGRSYAQFVHSDIGTRMKSQDNGASINSQLYAASG
jgi:hypothetical protein